MAGQALTVHAQAAGVLSVASLEINDFPLVKFLLQAADGEGRIVGDLKAEDLQILEDGFARPVTELARVQPGTQVIVAVNESPALTNQIQGVSYYRIFHQTLDAWAAALPKNPNDNYSYVTNNGIQIDRTTDTNGFAQMLAAYEPNLIIAQPGLTSLTMSLDMTTDPLPGPYMKRAILYITPMLDASARSSLSGIADRAAQLGTRIFIWLIAPDYALESAEVEPIRQLADKSGGGIYLFNGSEDFPDPETYLDPLRSIYQVTYRSGVTVSGTHTLVPSIIRPDLQITGETLSFSIQLSAPNPIFLSPPSQIDRNLVGEEGEDPALQPLAATIPILVEYPDGHPRNLTASRLYVDDTLVAENLAAPFDQFLLPLDIYTEDTQIRMRAEVVDELGLTAASIDTVVQVTVEQPQAGLLGRIFTGRGLSIVIAVSMASLVLGLVIYFTSQSSLKKTNRFLKTARKDPLTQPVIHRREHRRKAAAAKTVRPAKTIVSSPTVRKGPEPVNAPARLVKLSADGVSIPERVIPIIRRETSLGSDAQAADCVLDHPSVSGKHARLFQNSEGKYFIADTGSVAGTWVNYNLVNGNGCGLAHCDIIHFGLVSFRFEMTSPGTEHKPEILPVKAVRP